MNTISDNIIPVVARFCAVMLMGYGICWPAGAQSGITGTASVSESWSVTTHIAPDVNTTYTGTETGTISFKNGAYGLINHTGVALGTLSTNRTLGFDGSTYGIAGDYPLSGIINGPGVFYVVIKLSFFIIKVPIPSNTGYSGVAAAGSSPFYATGSALGSLQGVGSFVDAGAGAQAGYFNGDDVSSTANVSGATLAPYIGVEPNPSQSVQLGSNVTFSVTAAGATPLRYQWTHAGTNIANGSLYGGVTNTTLTITNAQLIHAGNYTAIVTNSHGAVTSSIAALTVTIPIPLGQAVDATNLTWTTAGNANWLGETVTTHDGVDAAQSGGLGNSQSSWAQTTVTGPGTLRFWWKVSSESGHDYLSVSTNGTVAAQISGEMDWQSNQVVLGAGSQTLRWTYSKDASSSSGQDKGWLDQVAFSTNIQVSLWTATGPMHIPREYDSSILLPSGKVLLPGGTSTNSSELYDPGTGTWTYTSNLAVPRMYYTMTLLPNGKVLAAGGDYSYGSNIVHASAELFDPAGGNWTPTSSMGTPRTEHTATLLTNGRILVTGGYNTVSGYGLATCELYNPATGTWTNTGSMHAIRYGQRAVLLHNGKVLVMGGENASTTAEVYDPATESWTVTGNLQAARYYGYTATVLPSGLVMVVGGNFIPSSTVSAMAELYDPATGVWTNSGTLNVPRSEHTATLLPNGRVLVAGGFDVTEYAVASAELFDPATGLWTQTDPMTTPREYAAATLLANGKVLMAGGNTFDNQNTWEELASAEIYNSTGPLSLMTPSTLPGGGFQFSLVNTTGSTNTILGTTNPTLPMTSWTVLGTATEMSSGHFQFTDPQAGSGPRRFYRVRSP